MNTRKQHRLLASILLLPFIAWSLTGIFFLVRPAYEAAYETLQPKTYASDAAIEITAEPQWEEMRILKTVLGQHLLVKEDGAWKQLDPYTLQPRPTPSQILRSQLVEDAISQNPQRYGELLQTDLDQYRTSTGVSISLNWDTLSFYQQGNDTRWIDGIYSIHYLRWTGFAYLDSLLGLLGLLLLLLMTVTGAIMLFGRQD